jgi:hypothetical protein
VNGTNVPMPALLKRMSMRPSLPAAAATSASSSASTATSVADERRPTAGRGDLRDQALARRDVDVGRDHARPGRREAQHRRPADAAGRARDHRHPDVESARRVV